MLREKLASDISKLAAEKTALSTGAALLGVGMTAHNLYRTTPAERKFFLKLLAGGAGLGVAAGVASNPTMLSDLSNYIDNRAAPEYGQRAKDLMTKQDIDNSLQEMNASTSSLESGRMY